MNTAENFQNTLIKDIVRTNFKTASVFEKYGIDFCCKGNRPLEAACQEKGIDAGTLVAELNRISGGANHDSNRYDQWDLDYLAQYIINNHHNYVLNSVPVIAQHLQKVVNAHGQRHQFIYDVAELFTALANELMSHMQKEERILFPIITELAQAKKNGSSFSGPMSISGPVSVMESEHDNAGNILGQIRTLTSNFTLPAGACNTFAVTYGELEEFELDLHKHVFLENSILFPKALELEEELKSN